MKAGQNRAELRIIEERPGRGGIVEIPLATAAVIDAGKAHEGDGIVQLGGEMFDQIVSNFDRHPGPTPVYFGHIPDKARCETPAAGFIEQVFTEGGDLWGRLDLGPRAWQAVVVERGFRAFSVEIARDPEYPTGDLRGWDLTGGAITNTPALDVQFVAASRGDSQDADDAPGAVRLTTPLYAATEKPMPEKVTMETLQADNKRLEGENKALREKIAELEKKAADAEQASAETKAALDRAQAASDDKKALELALTERDKRIAALEQDGLRRDITEAISDGLKGGTLTPAMVEGWERDPAAWLEKSAFSNVAVLRKFIANAPKVVNLDRRVSSGKPGGGNDDAEQKFHTAVTKIAADRKLTYNEAFDVCKAQDPEGYRAALEARAGR